MDRERAEALLRRLTREFFSVQRGSSCKLTLSKVLGDRRSVKEVLRWVGWHRAWRIVLEEIPPDWEPVILGMPRNKPKYMILVRNGAKAAL